MSISYTIAVCTRNRAVLLEHTLEALLAQRGDLPNVELLVVDNASTDTTAALVQRYPAARYILEPTLGIAHARNRAARDSRGDWLIYVDDDAVPAPGWFEAMQWAIQTQAASCILGKVDLAWENGRAAWFPEAYETLLSRYDLGTVGHAVGAGGYLLTTNTAFDRQQLLNLGGFRADLGHRGSNLLGGEDNDIFDRLLAAGCRIWYEPAAIAAHWVPRQRQTRRWLVRRVFWDGATQPLLDYGPGLGRWRYSREMGRDVRRVLRLSWTKRRLLLTASGRLDFGLEWVRQIGRFWMNWRLCWP